MMCMAVRQMVLKGMLLLLLLLLLLEVVVVLAVVERVVDLCVASALGLRGSAALILGSASTSVQGGGR
jgi:hypothetical protein